MFSTDDRPAARALLATGRDAAGRPVTLAPEALEGAVPPEVLTRMRVLPNRADCAVLARALARRGLVRSGLRVSVWRLRFDPRRSAFGWQRIGPVFTAEVSP
jgi:hypothetical protein